LHWVLCLPRVSGVAERDLALVSLFCVCTVPRQRCRDVASSVAAGLSGWCSRLLTVGYDNDAALATRSWIPNGCSVSHGERGGLGLVLSPRSNRRGMAEDRGEGLMV
jgi:hypothetical protein